MKIFVETEIPDSKILQEMKKTYPDGLLFLDKKGTAYLCRNQNYLKKIGEVE